MNSSPFSLIKLNPEQQSIIQDSSDLLVIYAGPGTGKTTTIIHKAIKANSLILTFSKQAAYSLESKLLQLKASYNNMDFESNSANGVRDTTIQRVHTIHSFAYKILKTQGLNRKLLDYPFSNMIFEKLFKKVRLQNSLKKQLFDLLPFIKAEAILQKEFNLNLSKVVDIINTSNKLKISVLLNEYNKLLNKYQLIDYMDILIHSISILQSSEDVLNSFKKFEYLMIDEFQDLNMVQYLLLQKLNYNLGTKLVVIGDPNQSIYGFRGAIPNIFSHIHKEASKFFNKKSPTVKVLTLYKNYRSNSKIINVANSIFSKPYKLEAVNIVYEISSKESNPSTLPFSGVKFITTYNLIAQASLIAKLVNNIIGGINNESTLSSSVSEDDETIDFSDFAIITRTNFELIPIMRAFDSFGIPYQLLGDDSIFNDSVILFLLKIIDFLKSGDILEDANYSEIYALKPKNVSQVTLKSVLDRLKDRYEFSDVNLIPVSKIVQELIDKIHLKYTKKLKQFLYFLNDPQISKLSINELNNYILNLSRTNFYDKKFAKVALGTMHASKGLEFKYVFIPNFIDKNIPLVSKKMTNFKYNTENEEKRLFYVAVTRAKIGLILIYPKFDKNGKKQLISPYYEQIKTYVEFDKDPRFRRFQKNYELNKLKQDQLRMI